ncbi:hypothetical protein ACK8HX_13220 [Oryzobacter sp. R7]|uniref:hypothetical protein n=1 Tax=Oryzobacter faecalis TaxID=3388656 RepID=UPI00398CEA19
MTAAVGPDRAGRALDLLALTPRERDVWDAAYLSGYLAGHEKGWEAADQHAAALHRRAVRVVRAMASIPERDHEADRAAAARREEWWANRRGDVA